MLSEQSLPPNFTKTCSALSAKKIYNNQASIPNLILFTLISLLAGKRHSAVCVLWWMCLLSVETDDSQVKSFMIPTIQKYDFLIVSSSGCLFYIVQSDEGMMSLSHEQMKSCLHS